MAAIRNLNRRSFSSLSRAPSINHRSRPAGWAVELRSRRKVSLEIPDGERARALIVHDMRNSAIQLAQVEGRCHRDGEEAIIYFAYAEGTVEESIAATVTRRMASMEATAGEDASMLDEFAGVIDSVAA